MTKICTKPFNKIEIDSFGDVYTCCPSYINFYKIGNIWDKDIKSIEDIWNSKAACNLRKKILNHDFSLCNLEICREIDLVENDKLFSLTPPLPEFVTLAYDKECNIQCITCRDKKIKNNKIETLMYNEKLETILLPLLNNAKLLTISGSGEAFYSRHSRTLLKKLTAENKQVKFNINTNGLLFNEKNCIALGLNGRIENVYVSFHALNEKIFNILMKGSNFKTVKNNIKYMSELQKNGEIKRATINSVISNINYKEIPALIDFAKSLNIYISFSIYTPWGAALDKNYEEFAVWKKEHKNYINFTNILRTALEKNYERCSFPPAFEKILT